MSNFDQLEEMEQNRIIELQFRSLIDKMLQTTNNNMCIVVEYIKHICSFFNLDKEIIVNVIKEIIKDRYKPTINEIIKINLLLGHNIPEIAEILNMNVNTIKMHIYRNDNNINTIILYPRLNEEQLLKIKDFLKVYYDFYIPTNKIFKT